MERQHMIGDITLRFRYNGHLVDWRSSRETVVLNGVEVPSWVEERRHGVSGPDLIVKVAIRNGAPEVTDLRFQSRPGQSEVRPKHLRSVDVDRLAIDLYAVLVAEFGENPSRDDEARAMRIAEKFVERQRRPPRLPGAQRRRASPGRRDIPRQHQARADAGRRQAVRRQEPHGVHLRRQGTQGRVSPADQAGTEKGLT